MKTLLEKSGNRYQFAFVHIKAVDHAGHDGDLQKKVVACDVLRFDRFFSSSKLTKHLLLL